MGATNCCNCSGPKVAGAGGASFGAGAVCAGCPGSGPDSGKSWRAQEVPTDRMKTTKQNRTKLDTLADFILERTRNLLFRCARGKFAVYSLQFAAKRKTLTWRQVAIGQSDSATPELRTLHAAGVY